MTTSLAVLLAVVVGGGYIAWRWSQDQYYVGADAKGQVVIFRGVNQRIAGVSLSHPYQQTGILLSQVPSPYQQTVKATDTASSLKSAQAIVTNIHSVVATCQRGYVALQQWVSKDNAYQAAVAQAKRQHKPAKDIANDVKAIPVPPPRPPKPSMCQPPTAFGIAPEALAPSPGAS